MRFVKLIGLVAIATLALNGCDLLPFLSAPDEIPGTGQELPSVILGEEFDLVFGDAIQIPTANIVYVRFMDVLEDSRCPRTVQCIWAGRARVLVEVKEGDKEPLQTEMIFGQLRPKEQRNTLLILEPEFTIEGFN